MIDLLFGKFKIDDRDLELIELAKRYHDSCDSYDNRICSGVNDYGESTPTTSTEMHLINVNAMRVRRIIIEIGLSRGFTSSQVGEAIRNYHKFNKA